MAEPPGKDWPPEKDGKVSAAGSGYHSYGYPRVPARPRSFDGSLRPSEEQVRRSAKILMQSQLTLLLISRRALLPDDDHLISINLEVAREVLSEFQGKLPKETVLRIAPISTDATVELRSGMSLAEMELLLSKLEVLMAPGAPERRGLADSSGLVEVSLHRADSELSDDSATLPVSLYLSDESIHEQVEAAVDDWLASVGLAARDKDRPVLGSWIRRMRVMAKEAAHSGAAQDAVLTTLHAVDARLVLAQDAQITATLLANLGPVITSLQPTKDAVLRVGALLLVKVDWTVRVFQLTAAQQAVLDHRPQLASSPAEIIQALELGDCGGEGAALPPYQ
jgi:hypothetical protein